MTSRIEILWKQALKTFEGRSNVEFKLCQENIDKLRNLMNKITAEDVNLNRQVLDYIQKQPASIYAIDIFENVDLTILIFILKHGVTIPMHDHPGMHGFLKVLSGKVQVNNYTLKTNDDYKIKLNTEISAYRHQPITLHSNSSACVFTPRVKNLHEISCIEGPAAFLDILSPPYNCDRFGKGPRPCTYFKTINSKLHTDSPDIIEEVKLLVTGTPPDFCPRNLKYTGPPLM